MCGRIIAGRRADGQHRICRRHDRARRRRRQAAQGARRSRHRQRHHRHLHHRQRPAHELLAGRRHDAVPQREEHQLGRRVPRAVHDPLARTHQARLGLERDRQRARLAADAAGRRRRARTSRRSCSKGYEAGGKTFKVHLDGYNQLAVPDRPAGARRAQGVLLFQRRRRPRRAALRELEDRVLASSGAPGTMGIWAEPFTSCALPKLFDLRSDPYERADITSNKYYDWTMQGIGPSSTRA